MESISSEFDIDVDIISEVINNDLRPILEATTFFVEQINKDELGGLL